jgi:hypothetical protein
MVEAKQDITANKRCHLAMSSQRVVPHRAASVVPPSVLDAQYPARQVIVPSASPPTKELGSRVDFKLNAGALNNMLTAIFTTQCVIAQEISDNTMLKASPAIHLRIPKAIPITASL